MKVRLIDVANKAKVSKSTASQYINGRYEYMSVETKERIRQAIEELNFVPNQLARSLKTEKTNTIGIMVSNITGPIFSQAIRGIDDYCKSLHYNVLIYNTDFNEIVEKEAIRNLKSLNADGIIVTSSGNITPLLNEENSTNLPIVHIHRAFKNLHLNTVVSDYLQGAFEGTEYLIQLGHKRIAVITRPYEEIPTRNNRIRGYEEALLKHKLPFDEALVKIANAPEDIPIIYDELMSMPNPPTAIFSMYALITIDLLYYFNNIKVSIPEDISVIAFDDLPLANLLKTPLTAITQSAYELGVHSAKLLINKIKNPEEVYENIVLPCQLVKRSSCKNLNV